MRRTLTFLVLLISLSARSQNVSPEQLDSIFAMPDTAVAFRMSDLYKVVLANHPVAKQASLLSDQAQAEIRLARGSFDPKLNSTIDLKNFKDTEYYNLFNATLKVPVWFPIDPMVSMDRNRGVFVSGADRIPSDVQHIQFNAGVSLPVGKGLFIDERRATVKQAILFQDILEAEQLKIINKLLLESTKDYWAWYRDYYNYLLVNRSIDLAQQIYDRVKINFEYGEASAVDTLQALITLQNRKIQLGQTIINYTQSRLKLSTHLWGENEEPLELAQNSIPKLDSLITGLVSTEDLNVLREQAMRNHPELIKLTTKLQQLSIENRLNRENLKPQLDLKYLLIDTPVNFNGDVPAQAFTDNYKFGMDFSFPLFLRKERAKIQKTNLKIESNIYETNLRELEIQNEITAVYAELVNLQQMIVQQESAVESYQALLEAELLNLELGESDLFKINFQQDKLIESQSKLLSLETKFEVSKVKLLWSAGVPYLSF